ncbi:hypothetical protein HSBAA_63400 [Vreelandella sulfidaeris]|uniref:Uncharacterized protein n=1 Tax=Vreelandella sulfidaeris TaxID=115553 RepID=A0A455UQ31_9GAMM|nr:hypothetical protein HSBAA_63400 [Halomonas sulfidaeris]
MQRNMEELTPNTRELVRTSILAMHGDVELNTRLAAKPTLIFHLLGKLLLLRYGNGVCWGGGGYFDPPMIPM